MAPKRRTIGAASIPSAATPTAPTAPRGRGRPPRNRNPQASVHESYQGPEVEVSEQFSQHISDQVGSEENQSDYPQAPQQNPPPADARIHSRIGGTSSIPLPMQHILELHFLDQHSPDLHIPVRQVLINPELLYLLVFNLNHLQCFTHLTLGIFLAVFQMLHLPLLRIILQCHKMPDLLLMQGHPKETTLQNNFLMLKKWVVRILMVLALRWMLVISGS